jgi:hypothetical protein
VSKIGTVKFSFCISNNISISLDSFRTRFRLEEKKWYVTLDRWMDESKSLLYSNPFFGFYRYPYPYVEHFCITESTGPPDTSTFPYVTHLFIDCQYRLEKSLISRFTRIKTLSTNATAGLSLSSIFNYIDMSQITAFVQKMPTMETSDTNFVRILRNLPCLCSLNVNIPTLIALFVYHWPHILILNIQFWPFCIPI